MTPPKLTRDTPIINIFHPLFEGVVKTFWNKVNLRFSKSLFSKWFHSNKPLFHKHWLDNTMASFTMANLVNNIFNLD